MRLFPAVILALSASTATAQFGRVLDGPFDVGALTGNGNLVGIEFGLGAHPSNPGTPDKEYLWVTGTRVGSGSRHLLYQIDVHAVGGPQLTAVHDVPAAVDGSPTGLHDLAYDDASHTLYGGTECSVTNTLFAFDCLSLQFAPSRYVTPQGSALACFRALAFDSGSNLFWAADQSGPIEEIDRATGLVQRTYAQHGASQIAGLGVNNMAGGTRLVTSFARGGTTAPAGYPGSEVVLRTHGILINGSVWQGETGLMTFGDGSVTPTAGHAPGGIAGGVARADDPHYGKSVLWCLQQGQTDVVVPIDATYAFGTGCPGSSGHAPLPAAIGDAPYLGNTSWEPGVMNVAGASAGFMMLGTSDQTFLGVGLPFDLGPFGWPGCSVRVAWDLTVGFAPVTANGICSRVFPIPNNLALRGFALFSQWVMYDPGAPGSFTTSPGIGWVFK